MEDEKKKRELKWNHLAVRPEIFEEFRELKKDNNKVGETGRYSDNSFIVELLRVYRLYLKSKGKKK